MISKAPADLMAYRFREWEIMQSTGRVKTETSAKPPLSRQGPALRPATHSTAILLAALEQREVEIAALAAQLHRERVAHRRRLTRIRSKLELLAQLLERAGIRTQDLAGPRAGAAGFRLVAGRPSNEP